MSCSAATTHVCSTVLQGSVFGIELPFVIQAKDTCNNKRTSGGDDFKVSNSLLSRCGRCSQPCRWPCWQAKLPCNMQVRVVAAGGTLEGSSRIVDLHKGLYEVYFTAPAPGAFLVHVEYADAGEGCRF